MIRPTYPASGMRPSWSPLSAQGAFRLSAKAEERLHAGMGPFRLDLISPHKAGTPEIEAAGNSFQMREGRNQHYFFQEEYGSAHILISPDDRPRIMALFPSEDSAFALLFRPGQTPALRMEEGPSTDFRRDRPQTVTMKITADRRQFVLSPFMGSARELRSDREKTKSQREEFARVLSVPSDWVEPKARIGEKGREIFVSRSLLDGKTPYRASIRFPEDTILVPNSDGSFQVNIPKNAPPLLEVKISLDFPPLSPIPPRELISKEAHVDQNTLQSLSFLSTREKFMAGSWRFLTYFGRDTMMTAMMLKEIFTPEALSLALGSVLSRLSPAGRVAHEEEIGSQAELRHIRTFGELYTSGRIREAFTEIKDPTAPVYDYTMVDDDFMLPLLARDVLSDKRSSDTLKMQFLAGKGKGSKSNLDLLLTNLDFVLGKAADHGSSLIRIAEGKRWGDWRDSASGLGGGVFPGGVNCTLVRSSLDAVEWLLDSGVLPENLLRGKAKANHLDGLSQVLNNRRLLEPLKKTWSDVRKAFEVRLSPEELRERVQDYLDSETLRQDEVRALLDAKVAQGTSVGDFLHRGKTPLILRNGLRFQALSLTGEGRPVQVMNSDGAFELFFGNPSSEELQDIVTVLSLPYPLGLFTDAGLLAANPAVSGDRGLYDALDRQAYHGTVIWKWQMSLAELGLMRQIERFSTSKGSEDLVNSMKALLLKLRESEKHAGHLSNSELWTFRLGKDGMEPAAYGENPGDETESDPVQLWSTVEPAVASRQSNLER
ncbi:MAG: hypothetical protein HYU64_02865 [Armatimonadetes bacterium]|nr:hypothetical protein [Armatimonadota bacterium]